jgi:hypothetical protein
MLTLYSNLLPAPALAGATYIIEANINFHTTNWVNIGSVMGDWNSAIMFTDTNTPTSPQRFYRFRTQ